MKKFVLVFAVLAWFTCNCFAKNKSIGIIFQPKYSNFSDKDYRSGLDVKLSYELGVRYAHKISPDLYFDARVLYSKLKFKGRVPPPEFGDPIFYHPTIIISFEYFTVPLTVNYIILKKENINAGIRGGFSIDKYLSFQREGYGGDFKANYENGDYNFSGIISVPIKYQVNDKISLMAEPQFNRTISDNHKSEKVNPHLYGIGINFGVLFAL